MGSIISNITAEILDEVMKMVGLEFVIDPDKILNILTDSKDNRTAVALAATPLGSDYYITCVEEVMLGENGGEVTVVIKPFDITGYIFSTTRLQLSDIKAVSPFKSKFENPYMRIALPGGEVA